MPVLRSITDTWSAPVTLTVAETWQCTAGSVRITTDAAPDDDAGHVLLEGMGLQIGAGKVVRYKRATRTVCRISRESFA